MPLRFLTAGESHGPELTAILEGMPAGLPIDRAALDALMARRQTGFGSGGRMAIERDRVRITAGVMAGRTTGAPIALVIANKDHASWRDRDVEALTVPRPGHADLSATVKYGYGDLRLALERASARELAARAAVGGVCLQLLARFGIVIGSYVVQIGEVAMAAGPHPPTPSPKFGGGGGRVAEGREDVDVGWDGGGGVEAVYRARFAAAEANDVRCPDAAAAAAMRAAIQAAARDRDTLGGVFEVVALGVPPGLGSHVHWDRRLTGRLLGAVTSIPAIKGAEIGPAFANAALPGTVVHDRFTVDDADPDRIARTGGRGGGLEGGITTGDPIVVRGAMKPISTTLTPLPSVDLATGRAAVTRYERSDICAVPRAAVAAEAMVAFVLADALLEKLGGDSVAELDDRFARLRANRVAEVPMDGGTWRFGYEDEAGPEG